MSYSPSRLDGKLESEMPDNETPTPSWFPPQNEAEKAESLVAKYRERAAKHAEARAAEDEALAAYHEKLEAKIKQAKRAYDPVLEEVKAAASMRQPRQAISLDDDLDAAPAMPLAKRRRKAKPSWPRYLVFGLCAMGLGLSLGYGLARKDTIVAFFGTTVDAAKQKVATLAQPLPQAATPVASASGSSTVAAQAVTAQPAVMTLPADPVPDQAPALKLADASQNQRVATALPDPVAPGDDLVAKADALMSQGDVASARQLYMQADAQGNVKGTLGVARTYDPRVFTQLKITGLQPDATKANDWYAKAAAAGIGTAN
ncbi:hypothetical protein [Aestuariivirga litoralis]|uniref:hypothetical protein n=1 Tax=Aestuariivirga litoralis TaxID=2650924 RepID=UPI0018C78B6C|nr:hypothetical protein [Aestuariivirga litoralis]MBG1231213.1 hypothetical protein [Aestuariivirga litoralis]